MSAASPSAIAQVLGLGIRDSAKDDDIGELACLRKVDGRAGEFIVAGPMLNDAGTVADRLFQAVTELSGCDEPADGNGEREEWAYRIGLVVGLRLARALEPMIGAGGAR